MFRKKLKEYSQTAGTFRFRGTDNTRIEALSDGVFALATALLVISTSIPRTYSELLVFMDDLLPFAICIALMMLIWYQHYIFFLRYGFKDATIVAINTFLLILILFYIYPLKFLFQVLYTLFKNLFLGNEEQLRLLFSDTIPIENGPVLLVIYGFGAALIFFTLACMYHIAYMRREKLQLDELEVFDTRISRTDNLIMGGIPVLSAIVCLVWIDQPVTFSIGGFIYWLYPIVMPIAGTLHKRKKQKLIASLKAAG